MHGTIGRSEASDLTPLLEKLSRNHPQRLLSREVTHPATLHRGTEKKVLTPLKPETTDLVMAAITLAVTQPSPPDELESLVGKLAKASKPSLPYAPGTTVADVHICHADLPTGLPVMFQLEPQVAWLEDSVSLNPADRW